MNILKNQETVLNNSPLIMKELVQPPKKLLKFYSQYQTSNPDYKVSSLQLTLENLKLISLAEEINQLETNNNLMKLNSLKDFHNSIP